MLDFKPSKRLTRAVLPALSAFVSRSVEAQTATTDTAMKALPAERFGAVSDPALGALAQADGARTLAIGSARARQRAGAPSKAPAPRA